MHILIIKLSSLGDLFHALPAVHNLKVETDATIDWATNTAYTDLVSCFDDVDTVIPFPRNQLRRDGFSFLQTLRQTRYDKIIDMQGLLKSALVARAAKGIERIGPSFHREGSWLFYTAIAGKRNKSRHAVIENLDIIDHLGLQRIKPAFPISLPACKLTRSSPHVAICPSSRWETKNWPIERFTAVATYLQQQHGASISLLGSPSDQTTCRTIADALPEPCHNLAGKTSIVEMGSIIKSADLLIANDSGPVHLAAAVQTPALVIFGPTDPSRTGPFGEGHRVLQSPNTCQPCMNRSCKHPDASCIRNVTVDEAIAAADDMLNPKC